ncbi:hypothetical protein A3D71_01405 [Candidatus Kaiserbacteria bacterium RIFCSPHIGHO2_02_FULL_55_20]|uniref:Uncharacterized protein n=1 Tax=Candidatus Kaiserbacteria bacterium RIFCSPHIGHO2_02_FULL_55_20 TaxID=1798497 RepID=A0A1F6DXK5_9BACT|nr:MAG: hypothetical protein A2680_03510 [Candidatus Kaiserbacteria bacterium RIFCSPHIGHO2_01_FULL_55_37]OGG66155.1 MAG: hypothetical protein A3D71_01405 [Candidatus Kaiserbacteria bacterium RIFCSPHIGHO2_02_FULL_55_20]
MTAATFVLSAGGLIIIALLSICLARITVSFFHRPTIGLEGLGIFCLIALVAFGIFHGNEMVLPIKNVLQIGQSSAKAIVTLCIISVSALAYYGGYRSSPFRGLEPVK